MILKKATKVKFTKKILKFYNDKAYDMCTIAGAITKESDAVEYMVTKLLGLGLQYKAKVVGYGNDCYKVEVIICGNKQLKDSFYVEYDSVKKV